MKDTIHHQDDENISFYTGKGVTQIWTLLMIVIGCILTCAYNTPHKARFGPHSDLTSPSHPESRPPNEAEIKTPVTL